MPASTLKVGIAEVLKREGFIARLRGRARASPRSQLVVDLKYGPDGRARDPRDRAHQQARPPRLRGLDEAPAVLRGLGIHVLSTPKGVVSDRAARRELNVGGEVLCKVYWSHVAHRKEARRDPRAASRSRPPAGDGQVKGPKGELALALRPEIDVVGRGAARSTSAQASATLREARAYHGMTRALIQQHGRGRHAGLREEARDRTASAGTPRSQGKKVALNVGFSKPVEIDDAQGRRRSSAQPDERS